MLAFQLISRGLYLDRNSRSSSALPSDLMLKDRKAGGSERFRSRNVFRMSLGRSGQLVYHGSRAKISPRVPFSPVRTRSHTRKYPRSVNNLYFSPKYRRVFYTSSIGNVRDHPVHASVSTGAGLWRRGETVGTGHRFRCNLDNRNRFDNPENLNRATIKAHRPARRFVYKSGTLSADIMREPTYHEILWDGYRFYTRRIWSTRVPPKDVAPASR